MVSNMIVTQTLAATIEERVPSVPQIIAIEAGSGINATKDNVPS